MAQDVVRGQGFLEIGRGRERIIPPEVGSAILGANRRLVLI